jgi:hypothetical protein
MSYIFRRPVPPIQRRPFNPALFDSGGTATPSASDSATATESSSIAVTLAAADAISATEGTSAVSAAVSAADTTTATDANGGIALAGLGDRAQAAEAAGYGLRFYGNTASNQDKLRIELDSPANPSVDVGAGDATWEFWIQCAYADNTSDSIADARYSNIILDRDIWGHERGFVLGVTRRSGPILAVCFGAADTGGGWATTYGTADVGDNLPHHIALTWRQSTSTLEAYVDGVSQGTRTLSVTNLSYPDGERPGSGANNEYLVFGGEKHGVGVAFNGTLSEIRVSDSRRYTGSFTRPSARFTPDANTMGLYHLNEQVGTVAYDWSGRSNGENGELLVGGSPSGPVWTPVQFPFGTQLDISQTRTETATATEGTPAIALAGPADTATATDASSLDTGNTPISSSDSATATEGASAVSAAVDASDSGTTSELAIVAAGVAASDSASATDAASVAAEAAGSDMATATEGAGVISAATDASDSITASESASIIATLSATDSVTATEGTSLNTGDNPSASDLFTFTESASVAVTLAASDTVTATDAASLAAALASSDSLTFSELATILALIAAADTAIASESSSVQPSSGTPSASENVTVTETASLLVFVAASDSATANDSGVVSGPVIVLLRARMNDRPAYRATVDDTRAS